LDSQADLNLNALKEERDRIVNHSKNARILNSNGEYLIFEADTNISVAAREIQSFPPIEERCADKSLSLRDHSKATYPQTIPLMRVAEKLDTTVIEAKNFIQGKLGGSTGIIE